MAVFYRKYRPQVFAQVVGQKHIIQTLQNQISQGAVAHAYLFTGSRGVGKTSVARILAKAVNCTGGDKLQVTSDKGKDACGECQACKAIEQGNFIDMVEVDAASNTGVDNIRELIEHVKFSPSAGKYKVFIIDEVHMLSKGAFNALLKTLEEPPSHAIFILATTEIQKVPATIISRTQRFDFKALSVFEINSLLKDVSEKENLNLSQEVLNLISQAAQGSVRDSLSILGKISSLGPGPDLASCQAVLGVTDISWSERLLTLITNGDTNLIPDFFDELMEAGTDFAAFNRDFLEYLRKALVFKISEQNILGNTESIHAVKLSNLVQQIDFNNLIFTIRLFLKSYKDLPDSPSPEIPLLLGAVEAALKRKPKTNEVSQTTIKPVINIVKPQEESSVSPSTAPKTTQEVISPLTFDSITLDEAQSYWPDILAKIKEHNGPLGSLLKASPLVAVESGKIICRVKFLFDKKTLEKNSAFIAGAIKEVCGKNLTVIGQLNSSDPENSSPVAALSDALKIFGGEIVE